MEKAGVTVVPVLRPVTDCRPFERLGLNQTGILGGREMSRMPRPPGKKGVGSARRGPNRIRHRPSPPTCRAWFPRLRSPIPPATRQSPPLRWSPHGANRVPSPSCAVSIPPLRFLGSRSLSRSRSPPQPPSIIQPCEMRAQLVVVLEGGTRGDFGGALLAYRSEKRLSLRPLPPLRLSSRSRFPFRRFT